MRRRAALDPFAPFVEYVTARLAEDPHLWGITLFDELQPLGFDASYPTLTRQIRARGLRPVCTDCGRVTERANAIIPHPAGEETQWDWLDLPDPPDAWGWGSMAHLLVGSLAHSGRWRGYLSPVDGPAAPGGGAGPDQPGSGRAHPAVAVRPDGHGLPPRVGPDHRHVLRRREALRGDDQDLPGRGPGTAKGWWRRSTTPRRNAGGAPSPTSMSAEQAQVDCDRFASVRGDTRMRRSTTGDRKATVATVAAREPLRPVPPTPYPLLLAESRVASRQALVGYRGNCYSVPPELAAANGHRVPPGRRPVLRHRHQHGNRGRPTPARPGRRRRRGP